jgi:hemolysin activation/secretion protein
MSPYVLVPFALLGLAQAAFAQQPPTAGGQLQQIPPTPVAPRTAPEIRIQEQAAPAPAGSDETKIVVRTLRVTGAQAFPEADLVALTGFREGGELSLSDLREMAARITSHYRANHYFVAMAYLPAQEVRDNTVTIAVSEGRYGAVTLRNESNLSDRVARGPLEGLNGGEAIVTGPPARRTCSSTSRRGSASRAASMPTTAATRTPARCGSARR